MGERIHTHKELHVFQNAMDAAMEIFQLTSNFPAEEKYSLVNQIKNHQGLFVQILLKHGANADMRQPSLPNLVMQKVKRVKHKYG